MDLTNILNPYDNIDPELRSLEIHTYCQESIPKPPYAPIRVNPFPNLNSGGSWTTHQGSTTRPAKASSRKTTNKPPGHTANFSGFDFYTNTIGVLQMQNYRPDITVPATNAIPYQEAQPAYCPQASNLVSEPQEEPIDLHEFEYIHEYVQPTMYQNHYGIPYIIDGYDYEKAQLILSTSREYIEWAKAVEKADDEKRELERVKEVERARAAIERKVAMDAVKAKEVEAAEKQREARKKEKEVKATEKEWIEAEEEEVMEFEAEERGEEKSTEEGVLMAMAAE